MKKISLATLEGAMLQEEVKLKSCDKTVTQAVSTCFSIENPGEYIATVYYENGKVDRYGVLAEVVESSFNLFVQTIEEQPEVTVDLGGSAGELGKHMLPEGRVNVKFPDSKGAIEELSIDVRKIGSIIHVIATPTDKYH